MSVQAEINRIEEAKNAIGTAIAGKGVTVPNGTKLDGMAGLINNIVQKGDPVLQSKTVSPATSAQTVKPDSGYDALSQVTVNAMPTATQATPSISVSSGGLITALATQTAGYVEAGSKSATKQLTTQSAQTITPGTSNKTIASGRYLTGTQTIKGDSNLTADNIAKGVSIFGVTGTHEGGEDITAETAEYTSLLGDLETAINNLSGGGGSGSGGSGGSVETCNVTITRNAMSDIMVMLGNIYFTGVDSNGNPEAKLVELPSAIMTHTTSIVCIKNTMVHLYFNVTGGSISGGTLQQNTYYDSSGYENQRNFTWAAIITEDNASVTLNT